jgi:TonB-dependent SusC/RagA subfamily outer membrane receptor
MIKLRFIIIAIFLSGAVIIPVSGQKQDKKIVISGTVVDPAKNQLPDVEILIDNKNTDHKTNSKGFYKIKVSPAAKIITAFSMMNGMKEVAIEGKTVIDFELYEAASEPIIQKEKATEATVDVGYGNVKKKDLTVNASQIDGQNPKFASYTNIYDMIRTEVPGVRVNGTSIYLVEPTALTSYSNNEPLIIVDGSPVSTIDDIIPSMVRSISILKGAAASMYGTRGSNGVILITLMKGGGKKK